MFKKFMAKLGVGSAVIDFVLPKQEYVLGERVEGEFRVKGGAVDQEINKVSLDLNLKIHLKGKEFTQLVASIPVHSSFIIRAGERKVIPFTYELPFDLLISGGTVAYFFSTRMDIAGGVDDLDKDFIQIVPPARFNQLVQALGMLGFREKMDSRKFDGYSQEFAFSPTNYLRDQLNELEFIAAIEETGIRLLLELDLRSAFGFGERELKREVFFMNEELDDMEKTSSKMKSVIEEMIRNPQDYPASKYTPYQGGVQSGHRGRHGGGLAGAMGGFAAGMLGGMLLDDLLFGGDEMEAADGGDDGDDGGGFDFFGGDDF
ncbi:sporulation protein [Ammoniphilus resinae]|uniref:Sporulation-control protein n=1 Tax=Ammoniphilus resinae TaxID=861532 RepID=A0ABS4GU72_9BACL|nr:sporulation protein [Ammoniphilus resinae]MBP1933815.1 sporulation-control protein [Ammoniphilus resinae]